MELMVNGVKTETLLQITLAAFMRERGFVSGRVVVECNGEIIKSEAWESVLLQVGDKLEIVTFVGGG